MRNALRFDQATGGARRRRKLCDACRQSIKAPPVQPLACLLLACPARKCVTVEKRLPGE
jgi:hypothetical protein